MVACLCKCISLILFSSLMLYFDDYHHVRDVTINNYLLTALFHQDETDYLIGPNFVGPN